MKNWKKLFTANKLFFILFLLAVLVFFYPFVLFGKVPIPADTIVGMYHPFRDNVWNGYSAGIPYKNFLITDPVRQQYVWRVLAMEQFAKGELPLWNPYSFSGTPLLANFQSAVFYPLNILFFLLPIATAWGILVLLQPLLSGIFLYLYLRHLNITAFAAYLGGFVYSFSGFAIVWLEWNTIGHVMAWLPLTLLSAEKIVQIKNKKLLLWSIIFSFSLIASFFAGHLQVFYYSFLVSLTYVIIKTVSVKQHKSKILLIFAICYLLVTIITSIQWLPTLQFISLSARDIDQGSWQKEGWFIPWQNLIQFIAPDFFGNPATGNYWGIWNYGEFIGYIGIIPLIFVFYALFFRRDNKTLFFTLLTILGFVFAFPNPIAKLIYQWNIPLLSTSQPTRLLSVITLSFSILAALGFDYWTKERNTKRTVLVILFLLIILLGAWVFVLFPHLFSNLLKPEWLVTAKRNLILPTLFIFITAMLLTVYLRVNRSKNIISLLHYFIVILIMTDLFRFGWKFTPFSPEEWIFPKTRLLSLISNQAGEFRIMSLDRRIMPPNFSLPYKLHDVSGYDPLYLKNYGQLISSWESNKATYIPASFNRILTPQNYSSFIADFIGVKYILSLEPLKSEKLVLLGKEGETYLYENKLVYPRAYFTEKVTTSENDSEALVLIFKLGDKLKNTAVVSEDLGLVERKIDLNESVEIVEYSENSVIINTNSAIRRLLVLTDSYYPTWKVIIDGKPGKIIKTNYFFRGVVIPEGQHSVKFGTTIL